MNPLCQSTTPPRPEKRSKLSCEKEIRPFGCFPDFYRPQQINISPDFQNYQLPAGNYDHPRRQRDHKVKNNTQKRPQLLNLQMMQSQNHRQQQIQQQLLLQQYFQQLYPALAGNYGPVSDKDSRNTSQKSIDLKNLQKHDQEQHQQLQQAFQNLKQVERIEMQTLQMQEEQQQLQKQAKSQQQQQQQVEEQHLDLELSAFFRQQSTLVHSDDHIVSTDQEASLENTLPVLNLQQPQPQLHLKKKANQEQISNEVLDFRFFFQQHIQDEQLQKIKGKHPVGQTIFVKSTEKTQQMESKQSNGSSCPHPSNRAEREDSIPGYSFFEVHNDFRDENFMDMLTLFPDISDDNNVDIFKQSIHNSAGLSEPFVRSDEHPSMSVPSLETDLVLDSKGLGMGSSPDDVYKEAIKPSKEGEPPYLMTDPSLSPIYLLFAKLLNPNQNLEQEKPLSAQVLAEQASEAVQNDLLKFSSGDKETITLLARNLMLNACDPTFCTQLVDSYSAELKAINHQKLFH